MKKTVMKKAMKASPMKAMAMKGMKAGQIVRQLLRYALSLRQSKAIGCGPT